MRRLLRLLVPAVLLLGCAGGGDDGAEPTATTSATNPIGVPIAALVDGAPDISLADYAGRPLVVNFFASWCAPCVMEMPDLERVNRAAGGDVAFLGVAVQDRVEDATALVADTGVTWDLARDPDGTFVRAVGGVGMPTTILVSAEGEIVARHTGQLTAGELTDLLAEHFGIEVTVA